MSDGTVDGWRFALGSGFAGVVLGGLTVGGLQLASEAYSTSLEVEARYVEIAVGILSEETEDGEADPLRGWAVDLLVETAPIEPSAEAQAAMKSQGLPGWWSIYMTPSSKKAAFEDLMKQKGPPPDQESGD